ncbi:MAG: magnesium and cobalt transport protein CorA [Spongiibacteraceae bacterium]
MTKIVNSVAYRNGTRLADIPLVDISEVVPQADTFVWLGLHEADASVLSQVQEEFSLHELAIEDARNAHQRSKIETYGDSLFIVLKTAQLKTVGDTEENAVDDPALADDCVVEYGETHFFVGRNFLVSIRHGNSQGYETVRRHCEARPDMMKRGPAYPLYALMDFIADNYQPVFEKLEEEFEKLEAEIFDSPIDLPLSRFYHLKGKLQRLRNVVLPVEDICMQLTRLHPELIDKDLRAYFRDIHDHVARTIEALDNLREMLSTAMSVNLAMVTMRQNDVVKRLAGWGAILALPTVVFSLYGMNFDFMPELKWHLAYPVVLASTAIGCSLLYRKLKQSGWL